MHYERILTAVAATPWAIEPNKGQVIAEFLTRKARGEKIPEADRVATAAGNRGPKAGKPSKTVALVPIYGTITQRAGLLTEYSGGTSTDDVGAMIDQCLADPRIDVILLDVDSPGGSVFGVQELGAKIRAARAQKKVVGIANSMAASAGYWLLSQASEVIVTPGGMVGSIGVYQMHVDRSKALEMAGESVTLISAGEFKTVGNEYGPLGEAGTKSLQKMVDTYYDAFVRAVAAGRGVTPAEVRSGFGKGDVVLAKDALAAGMVDRIATLDETLARFGVGPAASPGAQGARPGQPPRANHDPEIERRRKLLRESQAEVTARKAERERRANITVRTLTPAGDLRSEIEARKGRLVADNVSDLTTKQNPDPWRTAFHEAGHAVVAHLLGASGIMASILPDATSNGRVNYFPIDPTDEAAVCYAGALAEHLLPIDHPHPGYDGSGPDHRMAVERCPSESRRAIGMGKARQLVGTNGPAIRRVAHALMLSKTLDGSAVAAIVHAR